MKLLLFCLLTLQAVNASSLEKIFKRRNKNPVVLTVGKEAGSNVEINIKVPFNGLNGLPIEIKKKGSKGETFQYISKDVYNAAITNNGLCTAILSGSQDLQDFYLQTLIQPALVQPIASGINWCRFICALTHPYDATVNEGGHKREKRQVPIGELATCLYNFIDAQPFLSNQSKTTAQSGILNLITNPTSAIVQAGCAAAASQCGVNSTHHPYFYLNCFNDTFDIMFAAIAGHVGYSLFVTMWYYSWYYAFFICPAEFAVLLAIPAAEFVECLKTNLEQITIDLLEPTCPVV